MDGWAWCSRPVGKQPFRRVHSWSPSTKKSSAEEDVIDLLDDSEALELVEFDPKVKSPDTWEPPQSIKNFLEKYFNRALADEEREAIKKDFPRPNCEAVTTPKLGGEVKVQLKSKGKEPHHGAEKSLYKIQDQLLDVAGSLACLLNKEAKCVPGGYTASPPEGFSATWEHITFNQR